MTRSWCWRTSRATWKPACRVQAALLGAREVGFTVLSISTSLIAVFLPILLMGGIVGRLFREFALTLVAGHRRQPGDLADHHADDVRPVPATWRAGSQRAAGSFGIPKPTFARMQGFYERTLSWSLDRSLLVMVVLAATVALNVYLFLIVPKGFFPQQDTGALMGMVQADQSTSFQSMRTKLTADPEDRAARSRGGQRGGVHRRATDEHGQPVRGTQAVDAARRLRRPGDQPPAAEAGACGRRPAVPASGAGHPRRGPPIQRAIPIYAAGR